VGLLCLVAALVLGIKPVQKTMNEFANGGTLRGVETCISYSSSDLVSPEAIKARCINAFQKRLYRNEHATGRAGPRRGRDNLFWGGRLENKTADHVTTWVQISVSIFEDDGTETEIFGETPIWIDPLDAAEFEVELPELTDEELKGKDFCEHDMEERASCFSWGVTDVKGLKI